jgi:hypothetical protein
MRNNMPLTHEWRSMVKQLVLAFELVLLRIFCLNGASSQLELSTSSTSSSSSSSDTRQEGVFFGADYFNTHTNTYTCHHHQSIDINCVCDGSKDKTSRKRVYHTKRRNIYCICPRVNGWQIL